MKTTENSPPALQLDSDRRYRQIVENSPSAVFSIDQQGCITGWNKACETLLGCGEKMLGQSYQGLIASEDQRRVVAALVERVFQGETFADVNITFCSPAHADLVVTARLYPLFDGGRVVECVFANTDITQRRRAEDLLRASEERYRLLFEQAMDGIAVLDEYGFFTEVNSRFAAMVGYSRDRLLHLNLVELIPEAEQISLSRQLNDLFQANELLFECRFKHQNGALMDTEISAQLIDSDHIQWIIRNITERKKTERQTFDLAVERERVRVLAEFVQNASHEFRTPLSIINTSLYLMEKLADPERKKAQVERIAEQVRSITKLVEDLLTMSHLDGNPQFHFKTIDLHHPLGEIEMALETSIREKQHQLVRDLFPQPLPVWVDAEQMRQAFMNILNNAIRYTPPGGVITLRTSTTKSHAVVEIQDTGIGISPAALNHIFECFYRADEAHSTRGFGLGLPIAQKIVEAHQGWIKVESEVGVGSLFRIYLPLSANQS